MAASAYHSSGGNDPSKLGVAANRRRSARASTGLSGLNGASSLVNGRPPGGALS
jgi:hypothetical protein